MNDESVRQTDTLISILQDQIDYLLAMVVRPVVQQQLLVILLILPISLLLPEFVRRWRHRRGMTTRQSELEGTSRRMRLASATIYLFAPLLALLLLNLAIRLFALRGIPDGLLV